MVMLRENIEITGKLSSFVLEAHEKGVISGREAETITHALDAHIAIFSKQMKKTVGGNLSAVRDSETGSISVGHTLSGSPKHCGDGRSHEGNGLPARPNTGDSGKSAGSKGSFTGLAQDEDDRPMSAARSITAESWMGMEDERPVSSSQSWKPRDSLAQLERSDSGHLETAQVSSPDLTGKKRVERLMALLNDH